jgi:hypothetical protein
MRSAVLLGAGCSYGTLLQRPAVCPPLASGFGPTLSSRVPIWATEYPELSKIAVHLHKTLADVGLEELWTCIDYHAKFLDAFGRSWDQNVSPELKKALLVLYGRLCDAEADKLRSQALLPWRA